MPSAVSEIPLGHNIDVEWVKNQIEVGEYYLQSGQNEAVRKAWEDKLVFLRYELERIKEK